MCLLAPLLIVFFCRLSERNCVDIVKRLIEMKLINVIFTNDGKEYITSDHLTREIENELYSSGGRIAISDLVTILNVDYAHIENKANAIVANSHGQVNLVLEQLVSKEYKDNLTSEIDLALQEVGTILVSELSKQYNLPTEFLLNMLDERIGGLAKLDKATRTLYTNDYLARFESKIQGIFSAITLPVTFQSLVNRYTIPEKILTSTVENLLSRGRICGALSGSTFIPEIYSKNQLDYINNFFKHNRYLEYSTLSKLGISNAFLVKKFGPDIIPLEGCAVDRLLFFQIETTLEDVIQNASFVDLFDIMPSVLSPNDVDLLVKKSLENNATFAQDIVVLCETIAVTKSFIEKIKSHFGDLMKTKSQQDLARGAILDYFAKNKRENFSVEEKKDFEEKKKGKGKKAAGGGAGSQGREVKIKAVKKKYKTGKGDRDDEEEEKGGLKFLDMKEIIQVVTRAVAKEKQDIEEVNEAFIEALAAYIEHSLQKKYEQVAQELFISHSAQAGKMSFGELEKVVNQQLGQIFMFSKGLEKFDGEFLGRIF